MQNMVLAKTRRYVERTFGNTLVLVPLLGDLPAGDVVQLDTISKEIWNLIDGEKTVQDIIEALLENYDVTSAQLVDDVFSFLDSLKRISALEEVLQLDTE